MRFGLLYEHQLPRPWAAGDERRMFAEALEQVALADRLGFHSVWAVERHFLEEHSHSSAPEVFLAACSQRTSTIRLGLASTALPPGYAHPARIAEAVATLDLVSDGRVEFGSAETSTGVELEGFGIDRATKRGQWIEALDLVTRMFVETPFAGAEGRYVTMPPRNVVPKPQQAPHPPLWLACTRRDTVLLAAETGIGALSLAFAEPDEVAEWVRAYEEIVEGERCLPIGFALNPKVATALPMMVARDEAEAITRGIDGAHFHGYATAHYGSFGEHRPGVTSLGDDFARAREEVGFSREAIRAEGAPLGVRVMGEGAASLRGAIGTPEQVAELCRRYEEAGVDELVFLVQTGATRHEHVCEALELFAAEVMPEFAARDAAREEDRRARVAALQAVALARREPAATAPADVVVAPTAGGPPVGASPDRAAAATPAPPPVASPPSRAQAFAARVEARGEAALAAFVRRADDARLERTVVSDRGLRILFAGMGRRFDPVAAAGFTGQIQWTLTAARGPRSYTVEVDGRRAQIRPGEAQDPRLVLSLSVADFARFATGELPPAKALISGRLRIRGDLAAAAKLGPMFGRAGPF